MNNYFQDIEFHLIEHISETKERILIAVAWFTNLKISNALIELKDIDIDIVVDDNKINRESTAIKNLINNSIKISFIKDLQKKYYLMHNKFCVIDNKIVLTGSYNWTNNAKTNNENLAMILDKNIAASYNMEFSKIKNKKYNIDRISFSQAEVENLTELIEKRFIELLKKNRNNLENGLFYKWTDIRMKNQIREINERVRNTVKDKVGSIGIYSDLIAKYGIEFNYLATEEEKAKSRHKYAKEGIENIESYSNIDFQILKIKAIQKILYKYQKLIQIKTSNEETERILEMVDFLIKEKIFIDKKLKNILY